MTNEKRDEFRSSTAQNTRRRNATNTSLEENKSDETTVAVTTQESLDGMRERGCFSFKRAIQKWNMKYVDIPRVQGRR